jgi:long-subunit acyl-CoA synthetase (AMP-forming)
MRLKYMPRLFTQEAGQITPALKIRRKAIIENNRNLIDAMYQRPQGRSDDVPEQ